MRLRASASDATSVHVSRATASMSETGTLGAGVETIECDLQSYASVRAAAAKLNGIAAEFGGLDALVNNAGVMGVPDERTSDGFDVQMQTNHLSHFLLTKLVMSSLEAAAASRGEAVTPGVFRSLGRAANVPSPTTMVAAPNRNHSILCRGF